MALADCYKIDLPKIHDPRGNLTFVEQERHIPFVIKRVYYLYDVPVPSHLSKAYAEMQVPQGKFSLSEAIALSELSMPIGPHLNLTQVE